MSHKRAVTLAASIGNKDSLGWNTQNHRLREVAETMMNAKVLVVLASMVSWTIASTIAMADTPSTLQLEQIPLWTIPLPGEKPGLEGIRLTLEQQEKIEQIQQEIQAELKASGLEPSSLMLEFSLSDVAPEWIEIGRLPPDQQTKLAEIAQTYRQKITEVLTPAQQQVFKNLPDLLLEAP